MEVLPNAKPNLLSDQKIEIDLTGESASERLPTEVELTEGPKILISRSDVFYDDDVAQDDQQLREFSEIIFLRKFNNWIKSVLINKYIDRMPVKQKPSIFDLCSGKGGDLGKWMKKKPGHYVALEYQQALIDKAIDRLKQMKPQFPSVFIVADAGDQHTTIDQLLRTHEEFKGFGQRIVFDIVSCQFSMHYLFETEAKLDAFLHNVADRLTPGGYYIGTTVDAERVVSLVRGREDQSLSISNKFYSIQLGQSVFDRDSSPYGQRMYFYLKDAVGRERMTEDRAVYVPEFLVQFDNLEKVAREKFGLELVEKKNLLEFYQENISDPINQEIFYRMVGSQVDGKLSQDDLDQQWEICSMYLIFAFKKMGPIDKRHHDNFGNMKTVRKINVKEWR